MCSGIYIHIPFCHQGCKYCHFTTVPYDDTRIDIYTECVVKEIQKYSETCGQERKMDTIYFGGGTPSLLSEHCIRDILDICNISFDIQNECEISLEANPDTIVGDKANALIRSGINRLSIGAQSFHDLELRILGRRHNAACIDESVRLSKRSGISNINLDLLLGLPDQTPESWNETLTGAVSLNVDHISVYMLDMDEPCPLSDDISSGALKIPSDDCIADMYLETIDRLASFGYVQYEISNFSRENRKCAHNLKYWQCRPVIGFGLSSHSFDGTARYANFGDMKSYLRSLQTGSNPVEWHKTLNGKEMLEERLFLGLRMNEGVNWSKLEEHFPSENLKIYEETIQHFIREKLMERKGSVLRLTPRGMLLSNEIFQTFV